MISRDAEKNGQVALDATDADGRPYIQALINKAEESAAAAEELASQAEQLKELLSQFRLGESGHNLSAPVAGNLPTLTNWGK